MKRIELERAWPAAEPPPGFSERVLEHVQPGSPLSEPARRRAKALGWLQTGRIRWLALAAVALSLAGMLLLSPADPARGGDVFAAEPRVVVIGERAIAEMSSGAHLRWSGDGLQQAVQQDRGAVTYRVLPGATFRVQTPHGDVTVLGTQFRVVVADHEVAGGEPMKNRWTIAGAGAGAMTLGALLWVSVDRGSVRLSNHDAELVLHAGQAGAIGSDGIPHREAPVPTAPAPATQAGRLAERARARQRADAVRRRAAQRRAAAAAAKQGAAKPLAPDQPVQPALPKEVHSFGPHPFGTPPPPAEADEARRREYINRTVREQYFPVARDCYQELLERQPAAGGKIVLEFAIVGDGDAGVVDRVEIREDEDTIDDPEFQLCMRESMYTSVFEPPPPGAEETTVVYPVMLAPE